MIFCISAVSVVTSPFSFLILLICNFLFYGVFVRILFSSIFWNSLRKFCRITGVDWCWNFACLEVFDYWFNFITSDQSVQIFYFFLIQFLKDCTFLGIYPFHLGWPICWHVIVCSSRSWSLYFCGVSCIFSFTCSFIYFVPLSFLHDEYG